MQNLLKLIEKEDNSPILKQTIVTSSQAIRRTEDHQVITKRENKNVRINFLKRKRIDDFNSVPYGYKKARIE